MFSPKSRYRSRVNESLMEEPITEELNIGELNFGHKTYIPQDRAES